MNCEEAPSRFESRRSYRRVVACDPSDAKLFDRDGRLGVLGGISVLEQHDGGCDAISILIELLANAGQEGCQREACGDEACEKKNGLRCRSRNCGAWRGIWTRLLPEAVCVLKGAEAEGGDLALCVPGDAAAGRAGIADVPELKLHSHHHSWR